MKARGYKKVLVTSKFKLFKNHVASKFGILSYSISNVFEEIESQENTAKNHFKDVEKLPRKRRWIEVTPKTNPKKRHRTLYAVPWLRNMVFSKPQMKSEYHWINGGVSDFSFCNTTP